MGLAYNRAMTLRGLYLITPDEDDQHRLVERVAAVLAARPALLQYRNKRADAVRRRDEARALKTLCDAAGVPLVVNDDWRLAIEIDAAGVHLGEHDDDIAEVRRRAPALRLGASCYDDIERARRAVADGADYVAFGAFFPTPTKTTTRRAAPALLAQASALGVPRVAIGGITPDNARALIDAGADLLAVVGAVFGAREPLVAARAFTDLFPVAPPSPVAEGKPAAPREAAPRSDTPSL